MPRFKYLGVLLQPALGLHDHIEELLERTAKTIMCLGNLQKLPLELAMKIFSLKIMPIVRYGLTNIAPKLAKTTMLNLDRCKTLYLKSTLGVSRHTSNSFVLALTEEQTLCEDLKEIGYEFGAWEEYVETQARRRQAHLERNFTAGPAFLRPDWKGSNRSDRARICRLTYHGYHHRICRDEDFFERIKESCTCKYCDQELIDRYHVLTCVHFKNLSTSGIVREIQNC